MLSAKERVRALYGGSTYYPFSCDHHHLLAQRHDRIVEKRLTMKNRIEEIEEAILFLLEKRRKERQACCQKSLLSRLQFIPFSGDGSVRNFIRVVFADNKPGCIAVFPEKLTEKERAEFHATVSIGRHLRQASIPVPEIWGIDERLGLVLFEDLGTTRLYDLYQRNPTDALPFYRKAVRALALMQVRARDGFDPEFCCQTAAYDRQVMRIGESGYFLESFWKQTLLQEPPAGLDLEFEKLADRVIEYDEPFFLHRDFQSRNVMINDDRVSIIDFQAGRIGPPAYDLASLLIDPYTGLPDTVQEELMERYLEAMDDLGVDGEKIILSYPYLAVQRNLQIIGAFSFLSGKRGKSFFKPYILPSLIMLRDRLAAPEFDGFPVLRETAARSILKFRTVLNG
ncbi:MAG: aminoglycoside phosphotransferase [Desulfobacterales bacterium]|nr:MAG: aminoglycoside phosphotransferase [Desulfobacterales bacterium]